MTTHNLSGGMELLRLSPEEVRARQSEKLRETIELVRRGHRFYQQQWAEHGVDPTRVESVDDLELLPVTMKSDFMAAPDSFRLDIPDLPMEKRLLWEVMYTTGTSSGSPSVLYTTTHDHYSWLYASRMVAQFHGIHETDLVANLYPLTAMPMGAFIRASDSAFAVGAAAVTLYPGKPYSEFSVHRRLDESIRLVAQHRATVLIGIATYVRRFVVRAQELGIELTSVRRVLLGGEAAPRLMRDDIEARLKTLGAHDVWVTSRYGSTEMGTLPECETGSGWHNPAPDLLYLEIVDSDGRTLPEGTVGQLAMTHLNKTGTVLMRYLVGDDTSISNDPCPRCGRTGGRVVAQPKRVSSLIKVRGTLLNPEIIHRELAEFDQLDDYQIVVSKTDRDDPLSMDALTIRVVPNAATDHDALSKVAAIVKEATGVTPRVEPCRAEEIFDAQNRAKPVRFVDLRDTARRGDPLERSEVGPR